MQILKIRSLFFFFKILFFIIIKFVLLFNIKYFLSCKVTEKTCFLIGQRKKSEFIVMQKNTTTTMQQMLKTHTTLRSSVSKPGFKGGHERRGLRGIRAEPAHTRAQFLGWLASDFRANCALALQFSVAELRRCRSTLIITLLTLHNDAALRMRLLPNQSSAPRKHINVLQWQREIFLLWRELFFFHVLVLVVCCYTLLLRVLTFITSCWPTSCAFGCLSQSDSLTLMEEAFFSPS